nr:ribonuclease H-like domain-containing protein [Tanacetum cinerariifolium]
MDGSVIFNVIHKINGLKQGELSVPEYYHKLNSLWRKFDTLTLLPACTCAAHEGVLKHNQLVKLMRFLIGLNDVYQNIRSNILARDPLPDVKEAFNVVSRKEYHRGLHSGSGSSSGNKVQPTVFVGGNSNTKVFNGNSEAPNGASCSFGSTNFDTPFTKDQMMKILSLINEKPIGNASANMACMRLTFYNCNAMFNLHFEKFFSAQTCSYMYNLSVGWIIDSGANRHFNVSTKNMFNVNDIFGLNLIVGHPDGTLAKISAIGNLRLTSNVVLFDVLVILEYNISIMSVHKLIKDSKLFVGFDETKCYIQDLNLVKTVGTGSEASGLYLFDEDQSGKPTLGLSNSSFVCHTSKKLWHSRLGHPADQVLSILKKNLKMMAMRWLLINSSQVDEDATFATSLTKNTNISKGQHGIDTSIPRIISDGLNSLNSGDEPQTMRKSDRVRSLPSKFNDYVMPSNKKYDIEKHVNYYKLSPVNMCFASNLKKSSEPKNLQEVMLDKNSIEAMNNEIEALFRNKT